MKALPTEEALPQELRDLVKEAGAVLGAVIEREAGPKVFRAVEKMRASMAELRDESAKSTSAKLTAGLKSLRAEGEEERRAIAKSFTFFLELMNACENAYRSYRLGAKHGGGEKSPHSLVYVLTAHPTEARAPANIAIFNGAQKILQNALELGTLPARWREDLRHQLELAWRAYPTRQRAPTVKDEAEHIYRTSLRPEILRTILAASQEITPIYLRTWVGGDKDGHPGVDEKAMHASLSLSRETLLRFLESCLNDVQVSLELIPSSPMRKEVIRVKRVLASLKKLKGGDGARVKKAKAQLIRFADAYREELGALHPSLRDLKRLLHVTPGLVVPLELREASDMLTGASGKPLAITRMLKLLSSLAKGGDARWYARGFIVSMTESVEHLSLAEALVRKHLGGPALPVIPLFETVPSLDAGPGIVRDLLAHPRLGRCVRESWHNQLEIMVGYSDSSKQGGVFPSRLAIAGAMHALEKECLNAGVKPVFFQGSGGSVDRGGGSVQDQVAWWPKSALETYKVTIQGEMVERSFSSPEITRGQIQRVASSVNEMLKKQPRPPSAKVLFRFADSVRLSYQEMIHRPDFLEIVGAATPYAHLSQLKIGSRPARRTKEISVEGLRAIPWVLCWTQTRVLFQTWWGIGSAWKGLSEADRRELKKAYACEPVFTSYVKALGFTLAKVELPLWRIYLDNSGLKKEQIEEFYSLFEGELAGVREMVNFLSESDNPVWFRPWLGASIRLRAPMIHPLNLLQVLAIETGDSTLFRTTATGISAGMMTTG
ncbi:MAG: phosphoenolpyruvate carboxylase [Proteobacteria bacterium]|nr:MAG: phosphoenolpyruvate carboxylase [Pseudomonadota bacterium]